MTLIPLFGLGLKLYFTQSLNQPKCFSLFRSVRPKLQGWQCVLVCRTKILNQNLWKQDWVTFMLQPYWVEVMVEAEVEVRLTWTGFNLRLRLSFGWGWDWFMVGVELQLISSLGWVDIVLRLSLNWTRVEVELKLNLSWSRVELRLVYSHRLITFIIVFIFFIFGPFLAIFGVRVLKLEISLSFDKKYFARNHFRFVIFSLF